MTTAIMDQPIIFPSIPTQRVLQREVSNNTQRLGISPSDLKVKSDTFPYALHLVNLWLDELIIPAILTSTSISDVIADKMFTKNSTVETVVPEELEEELSALVSNIKDQTSDDILESNVSKSLAALIDYCGDLALNLLYTWILSDHIDAATASDLVILIGRIEITENQARLDFLERCLRLKSSVRVRYASVLALAYVDDRTSSSMARIRNAIADEPIESLKKDMLQLLAQLEKPPRR